MLITLITTVFRPMLSETFPDPKIISPGKISFASSVNLSREGTVRIFPLISFFISKFKQIQNQENLIHHRETLNFFVILYL